MKIKQLHYFMAIAQCLSYKYASEVIDVSPSLLCQQLVSLEDELGVTLFERNNKSVRLTPAGELLRERIPQIEELFSETKSVFSKLNEGLPEARLLHIGYEALIDFSVFTGHYLTLQKKEPDIHCATKQYAHNEILSVLQRGDAEIGFIFLPTDLDLSGYSVKPFKNEMLSFAAHKNLIEQYGQPHPAHVAAHCQFLCYMYNTLVNELLTDLRKTYGINPQLRICSSIDEIFTYIESGLGCTVLPTDFLKHNICSPDVSIIPLSEDLPSHIQLAAIFRPETISDIARSFLESFDEVPVSLLYPR